MAYKVTLSQIELMLQFLEQHRPLALGRVRGREGSQLSQRLWKKCADSLNREVRGAVKSPKEWKKYYQHLKCKVKSKVRSIKEGIRGTGGGSAEIIALTPYEERLYAILGGCSSPLPVRQNPLSGLIDNINPEVAGPYDMGVEYDQRSESEPEEDNNDVDNVENHETDGQKSPRSEPEIDEMEEEMLREHTERPRERRRQRTPPKESSALQEATRQMASMEAERIEVNRQLVCATNRQAAALEEFVSQVKRFVDLYAQQTLAKVASPEFPAASTSGTQKKRHKDFFSTSSESE